MFPVLYVVPCLYVVNYDEPFSVNISKCDCWSYSNSDPAIVKKLPNHS